MCFPFFCLFNVLSPSSEGKRLGAAFGPTAAAGPHPRVGVHRPAALRLQQTGAQPIRTLRAFLILLGGVKL